jgi:chromosome segregation ATPase
MSDLAGRLEDAEEEISWLKGRLAELERRLEDVEREQDNLKAGYPGYD